MSALSGLKLVSAKRPQQASPFVLRRNKLSKHIFEQIELAKNLADGKTYAPIRMRTVTDKLSGERKTVELPKRIKQWWFVADNGKVCLQIRYGSKVMELAKGKNSIEVANGAELISVLYSVKQAVEVGELDSLIESASNAVRERFVK